MTFLIGFELEADARRVMEVLPKRFARFELSIHPEKTRLVPFQKPSGPGGGRQRARDVRLSGFTHYWGKSRKNTWVIKRKTAQKRLRRSMKNVWEWCHQKSP